MRDNVGETPNIGYRHSVIIGPILYRHADMNMTAQQKYQLVYIHIKWRLPILCRPKSLHGSALMYRQSVSAVSALPEVCQRSDWVRLRRARSRCTPTAGEGPSSGTCSRCQVGPSRHFRTTSRTSLPEWPLRQSLTPLPMTKSPCGAAHPAIVCTSGKPRELWALQVSVDHGRLGLFTR